MPASTHFLKHSQLSSNSQLELPASKSIANRAIIINALSPSSGNLLNLSSSRDTQLMKSLISSNDEFIDAKDAGTTMRFLTAYFAVNNKSRTMTGTERMKNRPIAVLVDALHELGAEIQYLEKEGFPPLVIHPFKKQITNSITISADISSQYISALMMIAPIMPQGLKLKLFGNISSRPYIEMTRSVMHSFGADVIFHENTVIANSGGYKGVNAYTIEPDWSAASYWYSVIALAPSGSSLSIKNLKAESIQGDSAIVTIMTSFGVTTEFDEQGAKLTNTGMHTKNFVYDFTDCPDLAQTITVCCAAKGIEGKLIGLKSLKIKETDRIEALKSELEKFGIRLSVTEDSIHIKGKIKPFSAPILLKTYEDHRMAMSFAPLCLFGPLEFDDKSVVNKSYPHFWEDVEKCLK